MRPVQVICLPSPIVSASFMKLLAIRFLRLPEQSERHCSLKPEDALSSEVEVFPSRVSSNSLDDDHSLVRNPISFSEIQRRDLDFDSPRRSDAVIESTHAARRSRSSLVSSADHID